MRVGPNLSKVGEHNRSIAVFIPTLDGLAYVLALATLGSELRRTPSTRSSHSGDSRKFVRFSLHIAILATHFVSLGRRVLYSEVVTEGAMEQDRGVGRMSARLAAWLAWPLCLLCGALAAACLIFSLLNGRTLYEMVLTDSPTTVALATLIVSFSVVGALIASHRPENPIGWIFLAEGFFYGLLIAGDEYAIYALLTNPGALPLGAEASWVGKWIWAPGLGLSLVFLPLLFPDGHPPSHRWRPVGWLGGASIGLAVVSSMIVLWPERGPALVTGDESPSHVVQVLVDFIAVPMLFVAGLGAVISLFVRVRQARRDERQQIKWFVSAAALTLVWITVFGQSTLRGLPGA